MIEQILMGASAVITLSTAYIAWNRAKALEAMVERHNRMRRYAHKAWHRNVDLRRNLLQCRQDRDLWIGESARMAEVIGKHQAKAHKCDKCNQFASKRAAKTAELREYVASKAVS